MLKPKYVHGVNADEAPRSLLHRLQNDGQKVWPWDDVPPPPTDDADGSINWGFHLG